MNRRGQIALFIIIAVVLVGAIVSFFAFRDKIGLTATPPELAPVFEYYTSCIDDAARAGTSLAGSQGGRIDLGTYVPGSDYAPFSSHLFFAGAQIPYWFSVTGNGLIEEHVPTRTELEQELESFITERLESCEFSVFRTQGFEIIPPDTTRAEVTLNDNTLDVRVVGALSVRRGNSNAVRESHDVQISTEIGALLGKARILYADQQEYAYFDTYAADFLRLYAPVDGVSVQCAPEVWKTREVFGELQSALEANFAHIRFSTQASSSPEKQYFTIPSAVGANVRVLYSREWPALFEVTPADDELMVAEPVGNQKGLGILGFCYVPYHFVYDLRFPVLVQLYTDQEVFQFPLVVIVDKNVPRNALASASFEELNETDVCSFKEGTATISTLDTHLNPLAADISYQCFDQRCSLGSTNVEGENALLETRIPLCANGQLIARADNYSESRVYFSSNRETQAELILERLYPVTVDVLVDGKPTQDTAVVHFTREDGITVSALVPQQSRVMLGEGLYNISAFIYGNSSVTLPATTKQQCTEVPRGGLAGFFGGTEQRCFDITSPATKIDSALRGGGYAFDSYLLERDLASGRIKIFASELPAPTSLEQIQTNFELFDNAHVEVSFS